MHISELSSSFPRRARPEVLAPAGNLRNVKAAIDYGADAVYAGGKAFGMRTAPQNLSLEDFEEAARYAHARGARIYVTCNILPRNEEIPAMNTYLGQLAETGVDAFIVTDIGVLMSARKIAPQMELHISTQAGVTNYQAANALHELGASRVVLARELSLSDVRAIRAQTPQELEIECFVHGSMCMAFSGRCLISQHMTGRDANHGDCAQSCRWRYHVVEQKRPNQFFPVEISQDGTYLFNSQDMNLLEHIDDLLDAGISSLKIEGRAKSTYYVAAMANAYACTVDAYMQQRGFEDAQGNTLRPFHDQVRVPSSQKITPPVVDLPGWLKKEPYKVTHREYSTGFYYPDQPAEENIRTGGYINDWKVAADVLRYDAAAQRLYIFSRNKMVPGQPLEFLLPRQAPIPYTLPQSELWDEKGKEVEQINHPAREFSFPCPFEVPEGAIIRTPSPQKLKAQAASEQL